MWFFFCFFLNNNVFGESMDIMDHENQLYTDGLQSFS